DVSIIGFMLWKRTRLAAFGVIVVFHVLTHIFFNIGLFPFIMVLAVLIFFEPGWPRRIVGRRLAIPPCMFRLSHPWRNRAPLGSPSPAIHGRAPGIAASATGTRKDTIPLPPGEGGTVRGADGGV